MTADDTTHADCEKIGVPSNREVEALKHLCTGETDINHTGSAGEHRYVGSEHPLYKICDCDLIFVGASADVIIGEPHPSYSAQPGTASCDEGSDVGRDIIPDGGTICGDGQSREQQSQQKEYSLDLDDICEIISSKRRRRLIFVLAALGRDYNRDDASLIPVGDVAEVIAEATLKESTDRKAVYISLIQRHLSKLAEPGIITYDERGKRIRTEVGVYQLEALLLGIERAITNINSTSTVSE